MKRRAILIYLRSNSTSKGERIILQGRLEDGRSYGIVVSDFRPRFFIRSEDLAGAREILGPGTAIPTTAAGEAHWRRMSGGSLTRLDFPGYQDMLAAHRKLRDRGLSCYEGDLNPARQFLIDNDIHLYFDFDGEEQAGDRVDLRCINPAIVGGARFPGSGDSDTTLAVSTIAIDIETTRNGELRCISLAGEGVNLILSLQRDLDPAAVPDDDAGRPVQLRLYSDEARLLSAFRDTIIELDPDIITGWNVIGFDMAVILGRMAALGLPRDIGRSREEAEFLAGSGDMPDHAEVPGRVIIDAMRLQRMQPGHLESYSLESVASAVLGRGKREQFEDDGKMDRLDRMWDQEPLNFLLYCLEDSRLVMDILDRTGLMQLTLKRAELCGTTLSRAWASIHAFEQLYTSRLHQRRIAAPDQGVDALEMNESPGGTIIFPVSGRFAHVLLMDFKGLYPSIIRTFGIDPLSHHLALSKSRQGIFSEESRDLLRAPNNAAFIREEGILPGLLDEFYRLREDAKRRGDDIASYTFKILGNSFYGVLGSPGCRFAGSDLATAITSFAREILYWSRDFAEERGFRAIYGDTDSLFLLPPEDLSSSADFDPGSLFPLGYRLVEDINRALAEWIQEKYRRESHLEIEFENLFAPLFIPPLKSVAAGEIGESLRQAGLEAPQGRAKSYAGLAWDEQSFTAREYQLVIKGMEAVRSDWTHLARRAQREVVEALLKGAGEDEIRNYLENLMTQVKSGAAVEELVISKRLSKAASEYRGSIPPHVRAALIAEENRRGKRPLRRIRYLMTSAGPRPVLTRRQLEEESADLRWYMEKQLRPVLQSINGAADWDLEALVNSVYPLNGQPGLW